MTPLDTMLPGIRQRPEAGLGRPAPETGAEETAGFGTLLGDLAEARTGDAADPARDTEGREEAAAAPPGMPRPDAAGALLALLPVAPAGAAAIAASAQQDGPADLTTLLARAVPTPGPVAALATAADAGLAALMERASAPAAGAPPILGERPALSVLARETHFAPVAAAGALPGPRTSSAGAPDPEPAAAAEQARLAALAQAGGSRPAAVQGAQPRIETVPGPVPAAGPAGTGPKPGSPPQPEGEAGADVPVWAGSREAAAARPVAAPRPAVGDAREGRQRTAPQDGMTSVAEPPVRSDEGGGTASPAPSVSTGAPAAPALPSATLRQIADAVAATPAAPGAVPEPGQGRADGPVRLLTLQLKPDELGSVLIRMRLQDGRLAMDLQASRDETAELLRKDEHRLAELLRAAGYRPEIVSIQAAGSEMAQAGRGQGQAQGQPHGSPQSQQPGQGSAFQAMAGGQNQGGSTPDQPAGRQPPARDEEPAARRDEGHETHPGERRRGGVYL
ncbi:flagellar hook-length control protein FliK [Methylobacterium oxalidis]|uniref:Flagellar hook-length control protein-like C-terminal domain-containing protein n=1 Tax=Methylobacterium oxalidis TaxID=944322 RepID=A0A512IZT3_9HYPH|nr:flagellar hook-length control protein FliK [Methylobacterium oxalidis]GEP03175.1 hypothetical protein MOX02_12130 [Methylobacterium oxalidis]GLS67434.1 hypothetical protein GCM10007888_58180 [Methylobacterium oxalidis]